MSIPSGLAIGHLFESLAALNRKPENKLLAAIDPKLIDSLRRRILIAAQRDRTGSVVPDGYPTSGGGSRGSGIATSATERAAVALADNDIVRDRHHELTVRATTALEDAVIALNTLASALLSIDDLTDTKGPVPKTCAHCTGKRGAGNDRPIAHRGTVGDRLERAMDLCEGCWSAVRWSAAANSRDGKLPTDAQIRHHEETGRWRLRVA